MNELIVDKDDFRSQLELRIAEANRILAAYPIDWSTRTHYSKVDSINRELKAFDNFSKELLKRSFSGTVDENDYLIDFSKLIHMNDGLVMVPLASDADIFGAELVSKQVILRNMVEFFEDLIAKLDLIPKAKVLADSNEDQIKETYTLLILASNPEDQDQLNYGKEYREIRERIKLAPEGYRINIQLRPAVRSRDILDAINETQPDFVHFTGHGSQKYLAIQNQSGMTVPLEVSTLKSLLNSSHPKIKLMLLSACDSEKIAEELTEVVDICIGMKDSIGDEDAIVFASQFYSSLAFVKSVDLAYKQGITAIRAEGLDDYDSPKLFSANGVDTALVIPMQPKD